MQCGPDYLLGPVNQPVLKRPVKSEQNFLLQDVAMPMQEDPALVPGQPQRQCRHRVRMVDVDDVIVPAPPAQFRYHCRAQHCAGHFSDGVAENEVRIVIDLLHPGRPFRCGAHHITAYPERRYASGKVIHHFLDATPHGVEFSKLEDSHLFIYGRAFGQAALLIGIRACHTILYTPHTCLPFGNSPRRGCGNYL